MQIGNKIFTVTTADGDGSPEATKEENEMLWLVLILALIVIF